MQELCGYVPCIHRVHIPPYKLPHTHRGQDVMPKQAQELLQEDYKYLDVR